MARYIDVEKVELKGNAVFDESLDLLVPLSAVRKMLQMTPTADVAPKSEVAKEIFAEIAKYYCVTKYGEVIVYNDALEEIKAKYTEDENE